MLDFGLRQMAHFIAVAEAGSYREAAERMFIAQPALSISIRKLEEALGTRVFERGAHGATLTPAGRAFLVEARCCLMQAEQARQSARLAALGEWGLVRLGFVGSAIYRLLPSRLPDFAARHPSVTLELSEGTTVGMVEMLRAGQIDAAVIRMPIDDATGLHVQAAEKDDLVAVLPATHPLAKRKRIDLGQLAEETFIMFSRTHVPNLRATILEVCRKGGGFTPRVTQEATQAITVVGLVGSGLGVALVPRVITRFTNEQVRFVSLTNKESAGCLTLAVATRDHEVPEAARRLCSALVQT
ncbi:LysR family transcriptional regulator [Alicycliphilus denitrificans]|uniref:LysR family transcriptional regulator n=1 Tax=Alicycliphilus denitrificans TaxID=179636 RepID=UPI00095EFDCC|nr:LysR family transcriptional regulator [Alicycliphilus denitrificans]MBN9573123.1 LysR family transcriptional regulator [Alicycliphilus denitrificans]OJW93245.1 MAG: hypothetical protein BGO66_09065 [Alicycliphilus sp. 69-12]BCN36907.1 LysR family transcriptional regulator [Alicycliphilus denitrificans]